MSNIVTIHTGLYGDLAKRIASSLFGSPVPRHKLYDGGFRYRGEGNGVWYQHLYFTSDATRKTINRVNPYVQPDGELTFEIPDVSKDCKLSSLAPEKRLKWIADFAKRVVAAKYDPATYRLTPRHPPIADWSENNADSAFDFIHKAYATYWPGRATELPDASITVGQLYKFCKALTENKRDKDLAGAQRDPVEAELITAYREAVAAADRACDTELIRLEDEVTALSDAVEDEADEKITKIEAEREAELSRLDETYKQKKKLVMDAYRAELARLAGQYGQ